MENNLSSIKGQALLEFCVVIIILIPLCIVGFNFFVRSGEKRLNDERSRFVKEKTEASAFQDDVAPETEESELNLTQASPSGFEFGGKKIDFVEDDASTDEALDKLRSELKEQGWKEVLENGVFIFFREGERKYAWKMAGGFTLLGD